MKRFFPLLLVLVLVVGVIGYNNFKSSPDATSPADSSAPAATAPAAPAEESAATASADAKDDGLKYFDQTIYMTATATGPASSFYTVLAAQYPIWIEHLNINVTIAPGGPVENLKAISRKECELGMIHHSMGYLAERGEAPFDQVYSGVRSIMGYFPAAIQVITVKGSPITKIEQLANVRVGLGVLGGTGNQLILGFLKEEYGITPESITANGGTASYLAENEVVSALTDGLVDVAFIFSIAPKPSVQELETNPGIALIDLDKEKLDHFLSNHPEWAYVNIPAGRYKGQDTPIHSAMAIAALACHESADEEVIYNLTKAAWTYFDEAALASSEIREYFRTELIPDIHRATPLHPGALRYYQEIGVM